MYCCSKMATRFTMGVLPIAQHALASAARYESLGQMLLGKQSDWLFFYL